jgi:hypothetical protein
MLSLLFVPLVSLAQPPLPPDLHGLLTRMRACGAVWQREPNPGRVPRPGESDKLERAREELKRNHCQTLQRDLTWIRQKYAARPDVVALCDKYIVNPQESAKELAAEPKSRKAGAKVPAQPAGYDFGED